MQKPNPALTSTSGTDRPQETGWVAYHDVFKALRTPGLAMTWREPGGEVRWAAIIDRVVNRTVTWSGTLPEGADVTKVLMDEMTKPQDLRPLNERQVLSLMFPIARDKGSDADRPGLPPIAQHAAKAWRAVAEAELPAGMRDALQACMRHGIPEHMSVLRPKREPHKELTGWQQFQRSSAKPRLPHLFIAWERFELASKYPPLVQALLKTDASMLEAENPMEGVRKKWPGLSDAHLRRLTELVKDPEGAEILSCGKEMLEARLSLMSAIPVDWMPVPHDVYAFTECAAATWHIASVSNTQLVAASKGDWNAFAVRMYHAAGIDPDRSDGFSLNMLVIKCADTRDPVASLADTLMMPLLASLDEPEEVARKERVRKDRYAYLYEPVDPNVALARAAAQDLLYGGMSAPAVLETSARWHQVQQRMQAEIRHGLGQGEWPALFEGEFRLGDISVVAITSYDDLKDEGAKGRDPNGKMGLDHCILSRVSRFMTGQAHALSVRKYDAEGNWRRLSTCEVSASKQDGYHPVVAVTEHRGRANVKPDFEGSVVVARLRDEIQTGRLTANPKALEHHRNDAIAASIAECGYDWREPGMLANALSVWEPLLPRWARGLDPSEFLEALAERNLIPDTKTKMASAPSM